jgi:hypothetical protein
MLMVDRRVEDEPTPQQTLLPFPRVTAHRAQDDETRDENEDEDEE